MKVYNKTVSVPIEWKFCSDGQTLRSTIVGPFQCEIFKGHLKIFTRFATIREEYCGSRAAGMKLASKRLASLLEVK
jgi:hypothetical protein